MSGEGIGEFREPAYDSHVSRLRSTISNQQNRFDAGRASTQHIDFVDITNVHGFCWRHTCLGQGNFKDARIGFLHADFARINQ